MFDECGTEAGGVSGPSPQIKLKEGGSNCRVVEEVPRVSLPHSGYFSSCPSHDTPAQCLGSFLPMGPGRVLGQGQDRAVGGRSLWSQVPEPLGSLARMGPATRRGRAVSWLPL